MNRITQTESGKAWEYGLARQLADMLHREASLVFNAPLSKSQNSYHLLSPHEKRKIDRTANEVAAFLRAHDARLLKTRRVIIQGDMTGIDGDVRDIVIETDDGTIGVSAKHRHHALKHSLQSFNIDGTLEWGSRIGLPDTIVQFAMKPRSKTTAILHLNKGWQVSFRIHSAESKIIPSLKFDVQLEGSPEKLSRHEILYGEHSDIIPQANPHSGQAVKPRAGKNSRILRDMWGSGRRTRGA